MCSRRLATTATRSVRHCWPEPKIIVRFWIVTLILVLVGLSTLKIR